MTAPANDTFAGATPLGPYRTGVLPWTTIDCNPEDPNEWGGWGGYTAYFTFTATADGPVDLIMDGDDADDGSGRPSLALAVFSGLSSVPLYPADDPPNVSYTWAYPGDPAPEAHFTAVHGTTYTIQVDSEPPVRGGLAFTVPGLPAAAAGADAHGPLIDCGLPEVWTALPDATSSDRVYLSQLGGISGLRYSSAYPGGSQTLQCSLSVDPLFTHRALTPGRDCGVTVGGDDVWKGTLNTSPVGDDSTRQITADGDMAAAGRFVALGLGTHNALNANEVIDAARVSGRHSRFGRDTTLPVPDGSQAKDAAFMMDEALTQNANAAGKRWRVDLDRVIRYYPTDGTGEILHLHARQDPGRTMDGQVTRLDAAYIDALTGLYNVEHRDADPSETGSTIYPQFYLPDGSAYSSRNFTLYLAGGVLTAYVIRPPATTDTMHLTSPAATLTLAETSGVYAKFTGTAPGGLAVVDTGLAATYTHGGGASLGGGTQDDAVQAGTGSLGPTGNIPPREAVIDLTSQGAFTMAQVNAQLAEHLAKTKVQPHYNGPFTAGYGDLRNTGGVPVDLAAVQAGVQILALVTDPARSLDLQADNPLITTGEVEYDADTRTLTLTPSASPALADETRYIDPATGLAR